MSRCTARCRVVPEVVKRCQGEGGHPGMHHWLEAPRSYGGRVIVFWEGWDERRPQWTGEVTRPQEEDEE